jgi:hypothetical protein
MSKHWQHQVTLRALAALGQHMITLTSDVDHECSTNDYFS